MSAREGDDESSSSSAISFKCAICWELLPLKDRMKMPCCGSDSSSIQYCRQCLIIIAQNGIENKIGKCPTCSDYFTFENDEIKSQNEVPIQCTICKQLKTVVIELREGFSLCPPCVLGSRHMLNYECERCHMTQMIPHPMWSYQPSLEEYSRVTWACHLRCGDYTHWRIIPEDAQVIPQGHVPESWGQRELWLATVRELSLQRRRERMEASGVQTATNHNTNALGLIQFWINIFVVLVASYYLYTNMKWIFE